jgi:hypothetical protein
MDFFATLFSTVTNAQGNEPATNNPIDADNGGTGGSGGCIVA